MILFSLLNTGATVAHKTSTGYKKTDGHLVGINDIAHIMLLDGRCYSTAVFVEKFAYGIKETNHLITDLSTIVLKYFAHMHL